MFPSKQLDPDLAYVQATASEGMGRIRKTGINRPRQLGLLLGSALALNVVLHFLYIEGQNPGGLI